LATEKQKMPAGELTVATGEELAADARRAALWMDRYNASIAGTQKNHAALLREIMASVGEGACIRPPFHCDYGYNISLGAGAIVGAGSVVTRDVAAGATVVGNPARERPA
jgi:maltose O-acetyltransferase